MTGCWPLEREKERVSVCFFDYILISYISNLLDTLLQRFFHFHNETSLEKLSKEMEEFKVNNIIRIRLFTIPFPVTLTPKRVTERETVCQRLDCFLVAHIRLKMSFRLDHLNPSSSRGHGGHL